MALSFMGEVFCWLEADTELSAREAFVLLAFAESCNAKRDDCLTWIGMRKLARRTHQSVGMVHRCVRKLETVGAVRCIKPGRGPKPALWLVLPGLRSTIVNTTKKRSLQSEQTVHQLVNASVHARSERNPLPRSSPGQSSPDGNDSLTPGPAPAASLAPLGGATRPASQPPTDNGAPMGLLEQFRREQEATGKNGVTPSLPSSSASEPRRSETPEDRERRLRLVQAEQKAKLAAMQKRAGYA